MEMVLLPLCHKWNKLMYNAPMLRTKPLSNVFAFNYGVQKGLGPVMQGTSMLGTDLQLKAL